MSENFGILLVRPRVRSVPTKSCMIHRRKSNKKNTACPPLSVGFSNAQLIVERNISEKNYINVHVLAIGRRLAILRGGPSPLAVIVSASHVVVESKISTVI